MAAPSVSTTGTFNVAASLSSTTITGSVATNLVVTGLSMTSSHQTNKLKDGTNATLGAVASNARDELRVDFIYKSTNFPRIPIMEVVTVASSSSSVMDGKWYYKGDLSDAYSAGDFAKYSMTLVRHYDVDAAASSDLSVPAQA